jgi:hypothetical protein
MFPSLETNIPKYLSKQKMIITTINIRIQFVYKGLNNLLHSLLPLQLTRIYLSSSHFPDRGGWPYWTFPLHPLHIHISNLEHAHSLFQPDYNTLWAG